MSTSHRFQHNARSTFTDSPPHLNYRNTPIQILTLQRANAHLKRACRVCIILSGSWTNVCFPSLPTLTLLFTPSLCFRLFFLAILCFRLKRHFPRNSNFLKHRHHRRNLSDKLNLIPKIYKFSIHLNFINMAHNY